ncbi:SUMO-specific isopeptidase USPL1-like [Mytilus trossulus]|uniref:SUMO-specific isopeptidase USPL1-like n=1 Tax=Mytilus trossulus TaxID=6551 RepID=UPI003006AC0B
MMLDKAIEWCGICASVGKPSKLKVYQINLEEAVKLCEDEACNYPIGLDKVVYRKFEDVPVPHRRKSMHRQSTLRPPIFSANPNTYVPRPQPLTLSSQAPRNTIRPQPLISSSQAPRNIIRPTPLTSSSQASRNIIRPQPVSAFSQSNNFIPPSLAVEKFGRFPPSKAIRTTSPGFEPVQSQQKSTCISSSTTECVHLLPSENFQSLNSSSTQSQDTFISPNCGMEIDTSEVTEVIDVHFSSDDFAFLNQLTAPKISKSTVSPNLNLSELRAVSPISKDSSCSEIMPAPSSPFIPVRSNIGSSENIKNTQEINGIKPLQANDTCNTNGVKTVASDNVSDNVISQEIEIDTSDSPVLGEHTTYFLVEGNGKGRRKITKLKEEKSKIMKKSLPEDKKQKLPDTKDKQLPCVPEKKFPTLDIFKYFPQWQNEEALCWLDVVLCLFVHSKAIRKVEVENENVDLSHTILVTLFKAYEQACQLINKYRQKTTKNQLEVASRTRSGRLFSDPEESDSDAVVDSPNTEMLKEICKMNTDTIKTGAGLSCSKDFLSMLPLDEQENYKKAFTLLRDTRENIWKKMQPRLQCVKGKNDSPVLAIPLMVKDNVHIEREFSVEYDFMLSCDACGYQQTDRYKKVLPTLPAMEQNFTMKEPCFLRSCFQCNAENQRRILKLNKLPGVLLLHFSEGLPHNNFKKLEFWHTALKYSVTGFVQYRNDPDHFVTWIRRIKDNRWMEFDDLKSPICRFESQQPDMDSSQIHIVMWESIQESSQSVVKSRPSVNTSTNIINGKKQAITDRGVLNGNHPVSCFTTDLSSNLHCFTEDARGQNGKCSVSTSLQSNLVHNKSVNSVEQFDLKPKEKTISINETNLNFTQAATKDAETWVNGDVNGNSKKAPSLLLGKSKKSTTKSKVKRVVEQKNVQEVRALRIEKKLLANEPPEEKSERIIKNVLKNISENSNVVFAKKTETDASPSPEMSVEGRREALARLWKPKSEVMSLMARITKVNEKNAQRSKSCDKDILTTNLCGTKVQSAKSCDKKVKTLKTCNTKVKTLKPCGTEVQSAKSCGTEVHSLKSDGTKVQSSKSCGREVQTTKSCGTEVQYSKSCGTEVQYSKSCGTEVQYSKSCGTEVQYSKSCGTEVQTSKSTEINDQWKPVDKLKLTEEKYRGKMCQPLKGSSKSTIVTVRNRYQILSSQDNGRMYDLGSVSAKRRDSISRSSESSDKETLKKQSTNSSASTNGNIKSTNGHTKSSNGYIKSTNGYTQTFSNDKVESVTSSSSKRTCGTSTLSNYSLSSKIQEKGTVKQGIQMKYEKQIGNKPILDVLKSSSESRSQSRCSNTSLSSQLPSWRTFNKHKTFSGYQLSTPVLTPTSVSTQASTPSTTPKSSRPSSPAYSMKSEILYPSKRKNSVNNFITVKRFKQQIRPPLLVPSSANNSTRSSPKMNVGNHENDILENLYSALDIPLPSDNPDSLDLSAIENSSTSCLQNMDDFLDQLL